jgi:RimJ/RimL family protein N-acetyltransferase
VDAAREELPAGPVTLRRWTAADVDDQYRVVGESLSHIGPWMAWATHGYSDADALRHVEHVQEEWAHGSGYGYAIRLGHGALVGGCGMSNRIGPGGLEIGYWLHRAHTGHGYITAAVAALAAEAFRIGADRVEIVHDVANLRSGAVPRRLGFTEVARRPPQEELSPGEAGEDVVWRLLAP